MPDKRYLVWFSVPIVALLFALLWLVWLVALPWAANNNGFALPGSGGLPYRVIYAGRGYSNPATCARAGWGNNVAYGSLGPLCWQVPGIHQQHALLLVQVETMAGLFCSPIPLL